jgi:hypothetical protein
VKNERGIGMNLDEDRVNMMVTAMGRAIMELSLAIYLQLRKHHRQAEAVPEGNRKRDREGS